MDADFLARWRNIPTAIIADVSKGAALIDPAIRPLLPPGQQPRLFGRAKTARCAPPDFGAVLRSLDGLQAGDVLMIDGQGNRDHAMIGGILGGFLCKRGAAGLVCDGAVRDVAELAAFDGFSVFSRSITPQGPTASRGEDVNVPITIGGWTVTPGDLVIGDGDGLVSLDADMIRILINPAEAKIALEEKWITGLREGMSVSDTFGLPVRTATP